MPEYRKLTGYRKVVAFAAIPVLGCTSAVLVAHANAAGVRSQARLASYVSGSSGSSGSRVSGSRPTATCGGLKHWYAFAHSGSGRQRGTGAEMMTWRRWKLAGHPNGFTDEAVWILNKNNINDALEVGISSGASENGGFSLRMYPYYTLNNGQTERDFFKTRLPRGQVIWVSASSNGRRAWAFVYTKYLAKGIRYGVTVPRLNYEQAEVNYHNIWMGGGGKGSSLALEYETPNGKEWLDWGWIKGRAQKPYHIEILQPNGAVEGGYGSRC